MASQRSGRICGLHTACTSRGTTSFGFTGRYGSRLRWRRGLLIIYGGFRNYWKRRNLLSAGAVKWFFMAKAVSTEEMEPTLSVVADIDISIRDYFQFIACRKIKSFVTTDRKPAVHAGAMVGRTGEPLRFAIRDPRQGLRAIRASRARIRRE